MGLTLREAEDILDSLEQFGKRGKLVILPNGFFNIVEE